MHRRNLSRNASKTRARHIEHHANIDERALAFAIWRRA